MKIKIIKKDIESTKWAQDFKNECPSQYDRALKYASNKNLEVIIFQSDESGPKLWVIVPVEANDFWLLGYKTKKEAIGVCKEMGWIITDKKYSRLIAARHSLDYEDRNVKK